MYIAQAITTNAAKETVYTGVVDAGPAINASKDGGLGSVRDGDINGTITTPASLPVKAGQVIAVYVRRRHKSIAEAFAADGHDEGGISGWDYYVATEDGNTMYGVKVNRCIVAPAPGPCGGYYTAVHEGNTVTIARI